MMWKKIGFLAAVMTLLAAAGAKAGGCSPEAGRRLYESKCALCHPNTPSGEHNIGPNLHAVVGRPVAAAKGFGYSLALAGVRAKWTAERIEAWLTDPNKLYPGTSMAFAGLKSAEDRADIACFLAGAGAGDGAAGTRSPLERELDGRLRDIERLWRDGDARAMASSLYTADAVIAGEGMPQAVQGTAGIEALLVTLVKDSGEVRLTSRATQSLGQGAALMWMTWLVTPRDAAQGSPFTMRSLMVWRKSAERWKIAADMYSVGDLPDLRSR
ncbi:DUF4440 domain-containing protein [Magnetospirillum sp. 15-1]|uniref:DUF4440 domain-containing protein n=1 Tax=Magnetospirillum sp. 15-1 TaxID=1979370 RepID=UPI000BBBDE43|nr:DUF4440 domain-containing protein [Magnetospirillum sp. 15-1]